MLISVLQITSQASRLTCEGLKGTHHVRGTVTLPGGNARFHPLAYKLQLEYLEPAKLFMCFTSLEKPKETRFSSKCLLSDQVRTTLMCIVGNIKIVQKHFHPLRSFKYQILRVIECVHPTSKIVRGVRFLNRNAAFAKGRCKDLFLGLGSYVYLQQVGN